MPHTYIYLGRLFPSSWLDKEWAKVERESIFKRAINWIKQLTKNKNNVKTN